jgi:acetyl esterase
MVSESYGLYSEGYGLPRADIEVSLRDYLSSPDDATNPYASPLLAPDLSHLPPAYILVAEYDVLRDDGVAYAARLNEAGVPATVSVQRGHVHFSFGLTGVMEAARAWRDEAIGALRRANGFD